MRMWGWNKGLDENSYVDEIGIGSADLAFMMAEAAEARPAPVELEPRWTRMESPSPLSPTMAHATGETAVAIGRCTCGVHPLDDLDRTGANEANGAGRTQLITQTYDEAAGRYEFSGDGNVDAVLIGSRWTLKDFTFSFPTSGAFYADQSYDAGGEPSKHSVFNAQQQQAVRYAYGLISGYTGLTFTEVTETSTTHADFRFSRSGNADKVPTAYANFPSSSAKAGDVWFGTTGEPFYDTPAKGNWGMATMLHEMGHTLGLKHGHSDYTESNLAEGNIDSPPGGGPRYGSKDLATDRDGQSWSLMTYRPDPTDLGPGEEVQSEADGFNQPQTYMQYDIAALQYLYGANFGHNGGNTTYSWSPTTGTMSINGVAQGAPTSNKILMTLWDGNGIDTYDLSNYSTHLEIDLRPGAFSTFSLAQIANHQAQSGFAPAMGNLANALLYRGDARSLIENVVGGTGNDEMIGNAAANTLRGGAGAGTDLLIGAIGNDALYGEAGADTLYGDGRPGVVSGIGFGAGSASKYYGANWGFDNALDVTNLFTLDPNGNIADSFITPHVTVAALSGDALDYYRLTVNAGSTITLDVDIGVFCNTMIFLVDGAGNVLAYNNDSEFTDGAEGSASQQDSFLTHTVTKAGTYYVVVGEYYSQTQAQPLTTYSSYELQISVAGREAIDGAMGHDLLDGGAGADTMIGGAGNDIYVVDVAGDKVTEAASAGIDTVRAGIGYTLAATLENLVLTGVAAINGTGNDLANRITGNAGANQLTALGGNDLIDGGGGIDVMRGGAGNDSYFVNAAGDKCIEAAAQGVDTVRSAVTYTLGAELEHLVLVGVAAVNGTGNAVANRMTGNGAANALSGADGNDVIDGGAGADTMRGGAGNDLFIADHVRDKAIETVSAGIDTVRSSANHVLAANVEHLTLTGAENLRGTGNALANSIVGTAGANVLDGRGGGDRLSGGKGNDSYYVDNALDRIVEAAAGGIDTVRSTVSLNLALNTENLLLMGTAARGNGNGLANTIVGNAAANQLDGRQGNDVVNGGAGADRMAGGTGDDTFVVDNVRDKAVEGSNAGIDVVRSSVSFLLAAHLESLVLLGSAAKGTGNGMANAITGNAAANALNGGAGADALTGGGGADSFLFTTALGAANVDEILDFNLEDDRIVLDRTIFAGIPANGVLAPSAFVSGGAARDGDDRILYHQATGTLYYDPDGSGVMVKILFARVDPGLALTNADFFAAA